MMTTQHLFDLKGQVALVTGATHGIGMALAEILATAGAKILFNDIDKAKMEKAETEYRSKGIDAKGYVFDVTNCSDVEKAVAEMVKEFGKVDILINNAGIIKRIPAVEMSAEEFRQVIDIDLNGPFIMSKTVAKNMIERRSGKIINICSMMSELGRETVSAYAAAKGGLKMLTKNLACEWAQYNIQVNGIGPGYIATSQTAPLREEGHPFNTFIIGRTPAERWGTVEDLQGPALFLASKASDFVNGHILYVDGGILAYIGKQPK